MGKEELGKITKVFFGIEDHGILSFMLTFDFGGTGQGFGGYCLDTYDQEKCRRIGCAAGTDLILRLLNVFQVDTLNDIEGRMVYAIRAADGFQEPIIGLRTPKFDGDKIFMIKDWQEAWFKEVN